MATGVVMSFNPKKGFGFIKVEGSEEPVFVHQSDINMDGFRHLNPGDKVRFEMVENERGWKAEKVIVLEQSQPRRIGSRRVPAGSGRGVVMRRPTVGNDQMRELSDRLDRLIEVLSRENEEADPIILPEELDYINNTATV